MAKPRFSHTRATKSDQSDTSDTRKGYFPPSPADVSELELDAFFAIVSKVARNAFAHSFYVREEFIGAAISRGVYNEWIQFRQIVY